jgi:hypothetical protein
VKIQSIDDNLIEQLKTLQYQEIIQNVFAGLHGKEKK